MFQLTDEIKKNLASGAEIVEEKPYKSQDDVNEIKLKMKKHYIPDQKLRDFGLTISFGMPLIIGFLVDYLLAQELAFYQFLKKKPNY